MNDVMQASVADPIDGNRELNDGNDVLGVKTAGEQLSASRQSKKWTVQFVADQLKLSQAQIVALESDNFAALPKMVIVRGFVRAYAKLLKIDSDSLVSSLPQDVTPVQLESSLRPALSTPFVESRLSLLGQHDNNRRYIIGAVFLVVVVLIFLVLQNSEFGKNFRAIFDKKDVAVAESAAALNTPDNDAQHTAASSSQPAVSLTAAPVSSPVAEVLPSMPAVSEVATSKPVDATQPVVDISAISTVAAVEPKGTATVPVNLPPLSELFVLKFRQDSWVQVKTESGTILSSHLAKAGSEESFSVKQALYVKLGNAAGVDAILRGTPMTVSSERGNNVANLVVK